MTDWKPVIGLEVHAQMATESKLFCACPTTFGGEANHQTCPVCLGMPGQLPVLNRTAVEFAIRLGKAVGATVHTTSIFARKNYFYPDLPKGYQISQFEDPICTGGGLWIHTEERGRQFIRLNRIHMEEDAGMSSHQSDGSSAVDLNRAGVPLCEIVSEADIRSSAEAIAYMKAMRSILRYTAVSDGNMDEGSFRCDANVSLRASEDDPFGTKVELKNINSFRFVGQAIEYEIERQAKALNEGETIDQETRRWDPKKGVSLFMRGKEDAHDYRYFPEPDLGPLVLDPEWIAEIESALPELPRSNSAEDEAFAATEVVGAGPAPRAEVLRNANLEPISFTLQLAVQLAEALACVADHGYVHHDVKPQNVLINWGPKPGSGRYWLTDFGAAQRAAVAAGGDDERWIGCDSAQKPVRRQHSGSAKSSTQTSHNASSSVQTGTVARLSNRWPSLSTPPVAAPPPPPDAFCTTPTTRTAPSTASRDPAPPPPPPPPRRPNRRPRRPHHERSAAACRGRTAAGQRRSAGPGAGRRPARRPTPGGDHAHRLCPRLPTGR